MTKSKIVASAATVLATLTLSAGSASGGDASCEPDERMAEDMTCVPSNFWDTDESAGHIEEDEPGWDCRTMGNKICGPSAAEPVISSPRFAG